MHPDRPKGFIVSIVDAFLTGKNAFLFLVFALCIGAASIMLTAREEEPQIVVPMADVYVQAPGASAQEIEKTRGVAPGADAVADRRGGVRLFHFPAQTAPWSQSVSTWAKTVRNRWSNCITRS